MYLLTLVLNELNREFVVNKAVPATVGRDDKQYTTEIYFGKVLKG